MSRLVAVPLIAGLAILQLASPARAQLTPELFVSCHDDSKVVKIDTSTATVTDPFIPTGTGGLSIAIGVSFGPDGNLYVTSTGTSQILRYDSTTGAFLDVFVDVNSNYLFDARFGPDGDLYVPDSYDVLRYDGTSGAPKPSPGQAGAVFSPAVSNGGIRGLSFDPSGNPLVSTDGGEIHRLDKSTGARTVFTSGQPGFHGLTLGPDGNIYASCPWESSVRRYHGTTGAGLGLFVGPSSGGLNYAVDVAFGPDGDLYVASGHGRQILQYDGSTGIFKSVIADIDIDGYHGPFMLAFRPVRVIAVQIDIRPGSSRNSINLGAAGVVPVAILSSSTFDARTVDPATVSLAGASVKMAGKSGRYLAHQEDVNGDGLTDLVCQVNTAQFLIAPGDSVAILEGRTLSGQLIRGQDSIRIVP
jgi:WD40 repeat protein